MATNAETAMLRHAPSPRRVGAEQPAPPDGWPLHGTQASRRLEAAAAASLPPHTLMGRAGLAVARLALALAPAAGRIWIAAGPGNNGGDGVEAAVHLQGVGKAVAVSLHPATVRPADAAAALARAQAAGVPLLDAPVPPWALRRGDLAIDALLGLGTPRPPVGWLLEAIDRIRATDAGVLAVDLPTGLSADHGLCADPAHAVRADWTLSLLTLKPGLFTADGRDHAGAVWFDDLGVAPGTEAAGAHLMTAVPGGGWPTRSHAQHKGSFGDLWVVGGAEGMTGAAVLAARAALNAGAGRVYLLTLAANGTDPGCPELMQRTPAALEGREPSLGRATVVCGCGGGDAVAALLPAVGRAGQLLLDADALNALAGDPALSGLLRARRARGRATVLTPHPLEAARLLGTDTAAIQADRLGAARTLAARLSAVVVLKGSGSVVADPDGRCFVNASGNASLATAGTGDVLAGWIGGLWSQGLDALAAARLGVYSHGLAADRWAAGGAHAGPLPASHLIEHLAALRRGAAVQA